MRRNYRLGTLSWMLLGTAITAQAQNLQYQFQGLHEPMYQISIQADLPNMTQFHQGVISYTIQSVDPTNAQIQLSYSSELKKSQQLKNTNYQPGAMSFPPPPMPPMFGPGGGGPEIRISAQGEVLHSNRNGDDAQLPFLLGYVWQMLLPPLEANAPSWKRERPMTLHTLKSQPQRFVSPWGQPSENSIERAGHETIRYTRGATAGSMVSIQKNYEMTTDEKVGNTPLIRHSGQGQILFDTKVGLVESMEMNFTMEVNQDNLTVRIPVSLTARLLKASEMAEVQARRQTRAAEAQARHEAFMASVKERSRKEDAWRAGESQAQNGTMRTPQIGGNGGSPIVRIESPLRPVLGVRFKLGSWMSRRCIRNIEPLYEQTPPAGPEGSQDIMAKPGYAMGGLVVNVDQDNNAELWGMQVIFMRLENGKLVKSDAYREPWVGEVNAQLAKIVLGAKGDTVLGFFGRQGLNIDAIGLILKDPATPLVSATQASSDEVNADDLQKPAPAAVGNSESPAENKAFAAMWQKTTGKVTPLALQGTKDQQGNFLLGRFHRSLSSQTSYHAPATFRIVCMSDGSDFRIAYPASQIIFNWEMVPSELRVDGGPVDGQHKKGAGRVTTNEWTAIEIVVTTQEVRIFVNGRWRYTASGNFSTYNQPFCITAHNGTLKVQSISVVQ